MCVCQFLKIHFCAIELKICPCIDSSSFGMERTHLAAAAFVGKTLNGVSALCIDLHRPASFVVHHKESGSNISKTVWPRITKFYRGIRTGTLFSHTEYDVTTYFRSEVIAIKLSKIPLPTASGGISREWFKRGSPNFTYLSGTISFTNLMDMTLLAASSRLQNAIKYYTKVHKTGPASKESNKLVNL